MRSHSGGSLPNKRQKIFALDGSNLSSKFFSFLNEKRTMSEFQFNPEERNFTILQMVRSTQIIGDLNP